MKDFSEFPMKKDI